MVRGSPGPRNRTAVDVLWTTPGHRKALINADYPAIRGSRSPALGIICELFDLFLCDAELLLIGLVASPILVTQNFNAIGVRNIFWRGSFLVHR